MIAAEAPCVTIARKERPRAYALKQTLRDHGIPASVSYCGTCDNYHVSANEDVVNQVDVRIVRMLAQGYTYAEIAEESLLTISAVRQRLNRLLRRFYARSSANLVAITMRLGLLDVSGFVPSITERTHS